MLEIGLMVSARRNGDSSLQSFQTNHFISMMLILLCKGFRPRQIQGNAVGTVAAIECYGSIHGILCHRLTHETPGGTSRPLSPCLACAHGGTGGPCSLARLSLLLVVGSKVMPHMSKKVKKFPKKIILNPICSKFFVFG